MDINVMLASLDGTKLSTALIDWLERAATTALTPETVVAAICHAPLDAAQARAVLDFVAKAKTEQQRQEDAASLAARIDALLAPHEEALVRNLNEVKQLLSRRVTQESYFQLCVRGTINFREFASVVKSRPATIQDLVSKFSSGAAATVMGGPYTGDFAQNLKLLFTCGDLADVVGQVASNLLGAQAVFDKFSAEGVTREQLFAHLAKKHACLAELA